MAASYESIQTASATNANSVTVTKPTSLAEFDLMIAVISNGGRNDPATAATLSGWTQLSNTNDTTGSFALDVTVLGKVAQAADVAASNFTFSVTNTTDVVLGAILRLSGGFANVGSAHVIDADNNGTSGTNTYTGGVTPNEADTVMIIGQASGAGSLATHSNYAITTSNPTWTERADFGTNYDDGSSNDFLSLGIATATRSAATATGNYSVDASVGDNSHGFLISINPVTQNGTVTFTHLANSPSFYTPTMRGDTIFPINHLAISPTLNTPTVNTVKQTQWTNTAKPSTTWNNQNKP